MKSVIASSCSQTADYTKEAITPIVIVHLVLTEDKTISVDGELKGSEQITDIEFTTELIGLRSLAKQLLEYAEEAELYAELTEFRPVAAKGDTT